MQQCKKQPSGKETWFFFKDTVHLRWYKLSLLKTAFKTMFPYRQLSWDMCVWRKRMGDLTPNHARCSTITPLEEQNYEIKTYFTCHLWSNYEPWNISLSDSCIAVRSHFNLAWTRSCPEWPLVEPSALAILIMLDSFVSSTRVTDCLAFSVRDGSHNLSNQTHIFSVLERSKQSDCETKEQHCTWWCGKWIWIESAHDRGVPGEVWHKENMEQRQRKRKKKKWSCTIFGQHTTRSHYITRWQRWILSS